MKLFRRKLTDRDISQILEKYSNYFKITVDIELGLVVVGPKLHADAVDILKKEGGLEKNIWGGWVNLEEKVVETNAVWNIRDENANMEILDNGVRNKFMSLVKEYFKNVFI